MYLVIYSILGFVLKIDLRSLFTYFIYLAGGRLFPIIIVPIEWTRVPLGHNFFFLLFCFAKTTYKKVVTCGTWVHTLMRACSP